jgi:hypothetical protein
MRTCKYCGSSLNYVGEHKDKIYFACDYCELTFDYENTSRNRLRVNRLPESIETHRRTTKDLLTCNAVELFHLLKEYRSKWWEIKEMVKSVRNLFDSEKQAKASADYCDLYKQYIDLTKYKFTLENIIIEKTGFLPEKITDEFLGELVSMSKETTKSKMNIFIS